MATGKAKQEGRPRKKAWGRALLLGVVALWMFALGVLVGRGTAPVRFDLDQLQNQLAELKGIVTSEEGELFKVNLEKLKFFQNLRDTGEEGAIPHKRALFKKPKNLKSAQIPKTQAAPSQKVAAAGPAPAGVPVGGLIIQVASSKNAEATRRLVTSLQNEGYPAFSTEKQVPSKGLWYRIRVGPFTDQASADRALVWLKEKNFKAYILKP